MSHLISDSTRGVESVSAAYNLALMTRTMAGGFWTGGVHNKIKKVVTQGAFQQQLLLMGRRRYGASAEDEDAELPDGWSPYRGEVGGSRKRHKTG